MSGYSCVVGCHLNTRRVWNGCDDAVANKKCLSALFPGALTIGPTAPVLMKVKPAVKDHIVGNHAVQSKSDKEKRRRNCGCIDRLTRIIITRLGLQAIYMYVYIWCHVLLSLFYSRVLFCIGIKVSKVVNFISKRNFKENEPTIADILTTAW